MDRFENVPDCDWSKRFKDGLSDMFRAMGHDLGGTERDLRPMSQFEVTATVRLRLCARDRTDAAECSQEYLRDVPGFDQLISFVLNNNPAP